MARVRLIQGKGDWEATPPTGASDADLSHIANDFVVEGGVLRPEVGEALVVESDSPGMHVQVLQGVIYVENSAYTDQGYEPRFYQVVRPEAETNISISSNPSGQTRYDAIVQVIDKVTPPNDDGSNICPIEVVEGTPGESSISLPDNCELLGIVEVADGQTVITDSEILDYRRKVFAMPGFVSPAIQVYEDDTTVTFDSMNGIYNKFWVSLGGNRTLAFSNLPVGFPIMVYVQQGSGGSKVPSLPANIVTTDGDAIEWAGDEGAIDCIGVVLLPTGDYQITMISSNLQ